MKGLVEALDRASGDPEYGQLVGAARDRIAELEAAITMTLRYADGNGMKDWRVFRDLRKVMKST